LIKSFKNAESKQFAETGKSKRFPASIRKATSNKLTMLDGARKLTDLAKPPGNRLHALERDRAGQHSISINDQYRICFVWHDGDAYDVEITDYH
jgi:toxin HigB-1